MPKPKTAKIVSARSGPFRIVRLVIITVIVLLLLIGTVQLRDSHTKMMRLTGRKSTATYSLEVSETQITRERGLSNRTGMPSYPAVDGAAMLFVFDQDGRHCMWMKGMRFSLDIIWLNGRKEIVQIETDVSPNTFPKQFCPNSNARYVLEFVSGEMDRIGLETGDALKF